MIAAELQDIISGTPSPGCRRRQIRDGYRFQPESIIYSLGGSFRGSCTAHDNIVNGRIRGIAGLYNCHDSLINAETQVALVKELIKNDIWCSSPATMLQS